MVHKYWKLEQLFRTRVSEFLSLCVLYDLFIFCVCWCNIIGFQNFTGFFFLLMYMFYFFFYFYATLGELFLWFLVWVKYTFYVVYFIYSLTSFLFKFLAHFCFVYITELCDRVMCNIIELFLFNWFLDSLWWLYIFFRLYILFSFYVL
jgi:hypothetical protein